jgi:hypothetical protein
VFTSGGRAGSSLFAGFEIETLVFYPADTLAIRSSIEATIA